MPIGLLVVDTLGVADLSSLPSMPILLNLRFSLRVSEAFLQL